MRDRDDVVQQPLIMGDEHLGIIGTLQLVDSLGHNPQGIDVEAGIRFIRMARRVEARPSENPLRFFHRPKNPRSRTVQQALVQVQDAHLL